MALEPGARLDILELFGRYCHRVDHGDGPGWAALFTPDGVFQAGDDIRLEGSEQLTSMPGIVRQLGGGKWRHQVTSIALSECETPDRLEAAAYGIVTDWSEGGKLVTFTDYSIVLREIDGWRIESLLALAP